MSSRIDSFKDAVSEDGSDFYGERDIAERDARSTPPPAELLAMIQETKDSRLHRRHSFYTRISVVVLFIIEIVKLVKEFI